MEKHRLSPQQVAFLRSEVGIQAPAKSIADILAHFGKAAEAIAGAQEGDPFELVRIDQHQERDMRCLCGRPIKNMYVVGHLALKAELGLGSECFKYFFKSLTAAKMKRSLEVFEAHVAAVEAAVAEGYTATDDWVKRARDLGLISPKCLRRLDFGLPLTALERAEVQVGLDFVARKVHEAKKEVAQKLIAPYRGSHISLAPKDFQYVLALLEDGTALTRVSDVLALPLEVLSARIKAYFDEAYPKPAPGEAQTVGWDQAQDQDQPLEGAPKGAVLSHDLDERGQSSSQRARILVEEALEAVGDKALQLTLRAQESLATLQSELKDCQAMGDEVYEALLLKRETRQNIQNMGNQLGFRFSLLG